MNPPNLQNPERHFDYLLPKGIKIFSAKEVANILGVTDTCIRDAVVEGKIAGFRFNARVRKGHEKNYRYRITRDSFLLHLVEASTVHPSETLVAILNLVSNLSPEEKRIIANNLFPEGISPA